MKIEVPQAAITSRCVRVLSFYVGRYIISGVKIEWSDNGVVSGKSEVRSFFSLGFFFSPAFVRTSRYVRNFFPLSIVHVVVY